MNSKQTTDLLIAIQAVITLLISLRAFYLYSKTRSDMLFILGLAMAVIVVGGFSGLIGDFLLTSSAFNTFWFRYIGQTVSYLFIFFISLRGAERYMHSLRRWNLIATALLFVLLLLTPVIPVNTGTTLTEVLSGSRSLVCLAVFFNYYFVIYDMKATRFSFLMCSAFLLISFGIAIYTVKFSAPNPLPYDYVGDSVRLGGLTLMLIAFFVG
jgi:hypothetical protein